MLGVVLLQSGDAPAAEKLISKAVALAPDNAGAFNNLANAFNALGRHQDALSACEKALELVPDLPDAYDTLGSIFMGMGKPDRAVVALEKLVTLIPDNPQAHCNLGMVLRELGQFDRAIDALSKAIELAPSYPLPLCILGVCLLETGQTEKALSTCLKATELAPDSSQAFDNLGHVLLQTRQYPQAIKALEKAMELAKGNAVISSDLARAYAELGQIDRARGHLRRLIAENPRNVQAWYQLTATMHTPLNDEDVAKMESLLKDPAGLSSYDKCLLHNGLSFVMDRRGDFDRAGVYVRAANALEKDRRNAKNLRYDPQSFSELVDAIIETFTPEYFRKLAGLGLESGRPVFVVGMPRSGTTLTERILASHPQIYGVGELPDFAELFESLPQLTSLEAPPVNCVTALTPEQIAQAAQGYIDHLASLNDSAARVVDKFPGNYVYLGQIATLLPGAKIIHTRRDVRDVAVSCWMTFFDQVPWSVDESWIARRIVDYVRLMDHWRAVLPGGMLEVDYEQTVSDLETQARRMIDYLGLEWDPVCLEFHRSGGVVRTASVRQVRRPVHSGSVDRWKNYQNILSDLFDAIAPLRESRTVHSNTGPDRPETVERRLPCV